MMEKYNTVIFDLDGTLLNTLDDLSDSVNYSLRKFYFPKRSLKEVKSFVGNGIFRLMKLAVPDGTENPSLMEVFHPLTIFIFYGAQVFAPKTPEGLPYNFSS